MPCREATDYNTRSKPYSHYKSGNTVKFLIGIIPCDAISFASQSWVGRASDKELPRQSEFLSKLEGEDQVLADRGLFIREGIASTGAVLVPPYTKVKRQLPANEVEIARMISKVCIHVEQAI